MFLWFGISSLHSTDDWFVSNRCADGSPVKLTASSRFLVAVLAVALAFLLVQVAAANADLTGSSNGYLNSSGSGVLSPREALVADVPASDELQWKRAIDRDDTNTLRRLLNRVDVKLTNEKGKTALMASAKTGQLDLLETLLQSGLGIEDRTMTGGTSLMYAALGRQHAMISYLLNARRGMGDFQRYVDAESANGWTALMIAAAKGFDSVVEQLVHEGDADAWLADAYQWTPLMRAIDNRHTAVIRFLLEMDKQVLNAINENGATALHVAVEKGDARTVKLLLGGSIDREIRDNAQRTALDIAKSRRDESITRLFALQ